MITASQYKLLKQIDKHHNFIEKYDTAVFDYCFNERLIEETGIILSKNYKKLTQYDLTDKGRKLFEEYKRTYISSLRQWIAIVISIFTLVGSVVSIVLSCIR